MLKTQGFEKNKNDPFLGKIPFFYSKKSQKEPKNTKKVKKSLFLTFFYLAIYILCQLKIQV